MLPKEWDTKAVGDLFHVQLGKMLNKAAKEKEPQFKYLGNSNVKWGYFDLAELKTMHFSDKEQEKFALKNGDIVLCEGGEVGRCAIWRGQDTNVYYQKALHRLRSKGEMVPEFFQSYMENIAGTKLLEDFTTKTSIAHLTREKLIKLPVKTPPLPEQEKIAQILSAWNNAITATRQLLAKSQQQQKALMQQLLTGKERFPGFSGEWKDSYLVDVARVIVSPVDKKTVVGEEPVLLCNYTDVYYNQKITRRLTFMRATATRSEIERFTLQADDVVITKDSETPGDIAIPALVAEDLGAVVCGYHLAIVRPNRKMLNGTFLNYLFSMPQTRYYFFTLATGATRFGLSIGGINKAHFKLPPLEEQQKIASVLSAADHEIEALRQKLAYLKLEKTALMQQLLTGKQRVQPGSAGGSPAYFHG